MARNQDFDGAYRRSRAVAITLDGRCAISGSDNTLKVWDEDGQGDQDLDRTYR